MAGYAAVADVGETLVELLRNRMDELEGVIDVDRTDVGLVSPGELGEQSDVLLSLYLYRIAENADLKNAERERIDDETEREPPLALDLYYLLTAHPSPGDAEATDRTAQQHRILGLAMQVMRENAVVSGADLRGSLAADRELRVSLYPQSVDELTNIWTTFQGTPFRPSVAYLVSPVLIESLRERPVRPVLERTVSVDAESADPT